MGFYRRVGEEMEGHTPLHLDLIQRTVLIVEKIQGVFGLFHQLKITAFPGVLETGNHFFNREVKADSSRRILQRCYRVKTQLSQHAVVVRPLMMATVMMITIVIVVETAACGWLSANAIVVFNAHDFE